MPNTTFLQAQCVYGACMSVYIYTYIYRAGSFPVIKRCCFNLFYFYFFVILLKIDFTFEFKALSTGNVRAFAAAACMSRYIDTLRLIARRTSVYSIIAYDYI
jgi:hypothetical protein